MFFFKKHTENEAGGLVPAFFVKKKQGVYSLVSIYFDYPNLAYDKSKLYKTSNY